MAKQVTHPTIQTIIEKYKDYVARYYNALDDENFERQKVEMDRVNKVVETLDSFGGEGRLALIPLLDDADQGIRVQAAADLLKVFPDRATAVLKEIQQGQTIYPRLSAGWFLDSYAKGKWGR